MAPLVGGYGAKCGRKTSIVMASIMLSCASFIFALGGLIKDDILFYVVSLVARMLQGAADGVVLTLVPSIIAIEYPAKPVEY